MKKKCLKLSVKTGPPQAWLVLMFTPAEVRGIKTKEQEKRRKSKIQRSSRHGQSVDPELNSG